MGNISHLWYLKNSGGDWASTKCSLDECYSIPFDSAGDELYLQVDLPENTYVDGIWLCDLDGTPHINIKPLTDWKIIQKTGLYRLLLRVPNHVACQESAAGSTPSCFYFEIPLYTGHHLPAGTLASEPFHCPQCEPTIVVSSDYCHSNTDIYGEFIFSTEGLAGTQTGTLTEAKNNLRIQAKMKQMPSKVTASRNLRCFNYRSSLQERFRLQGTVDYPGYMADILESIFSGKRIFVNDTEYTLQGERLFAERNVAGRSMMRLDIELAKCEREKVHACACAGEQDAPPVVLD